LIAHAARTRPLSAGTLIGSGTVSNRDRKTGAGCLLEKRSGVMRLVSLNRPLCLCYQTVWMKG